MSRSNYKISVKRSDKHDETVLLEVIETSIIIRIPHPANETFKHRGA